jgi:Flp pilus assembly pilin Flp
MRATVRNSVAGHFINLGDFSMGRRLYRLSGTHSDRRGSGRIKEQDNMKNLVEKYSAETAVETEDGVVAIEYVLVAGLVAVGVAITFGASLWTNMLGALNGLI